MITTDLKRKTVADYTALPELIMTPSPTFAHQDLSGYLFVKLDGIVRPQRLGKVIYAPFDVFVSEHDVYQPDLLFVRQENFSIIKNDGVHGAPDLVIEILSPSTAYYDMKTKKDVYERIGVREYWIVDPIDHSVECFENSEGGFATHALLKKIGKVCSFVVPQFCIDLQELFATP